MFTVLNCQDFACIAVLNTQTIIGIVVTYKRKLARCLFTKKEYQYDNTCWFSHDVTKIQTLELLILLRFYFHDV